MTTRGLWQQRRTSGAIGALLTLAIATAAHAQVSGSGAEATGRDACLAEHEHSQELKLGGKLLESKKASMSCSEEQCPSMVRADCLHWLDELESAIPTIVVVAVSDRGDEIDVNVTIDGQFVTRQLDGKAIELDPGSHQITFERQGSAPQEMRLILGQGEKNRIIRLDYRTKLPAPVPLAPAVAPTPLPPLNGTRPVPVLTYVFAGAAIVAGGTATYFALRAESARNDAKKNCEPLCSTSVVDNVKQKALYSDLSSGIALLSVGTAVLLYATRPTVFSEESPNKLVRLLHNLRFSASSNSALTSLGGTF